MYKQKRNINHARQTTDIEFKLPISAANARSISGKRQTPITPKRAISDVRAVVLANERMRDRAIKEGDFVLMITYGGEKYIVKSVRALVDVCV